ncbi:enhanced intracellular survival protein Eis [Actinoplanes sp. L3-i22]|uniref:GNAT family N-acetyltransferase n=1 Tax=Actinoplanes sp. L3-i22 TaxID=2836373 RepID=UPI001C757130|nr:GNAT family N-acetyltransferase [Actinoplanes sp. L3-i22]BCY10005.1 GCN5 family acetyltransferase [Actinoplanes sp. L3-i22]
MDIRRTTADDLEKLIGLSSYAFEATPLTPARTEELLAYMRTRRNITLVAEEDGETRASVSGIPMRQNVRGAVHPMLGVGGVLTHPLHRRRGHVRVLMNALLDQARADGYAVSALHPFRAGFYQRLGYVGLPANRTVRVRPEVLGGLLKLDLPGEVRLRRMAEGWDDLSGLLDRQLLDRHGFAEFPDYRRDQWRKDDDHWLATVHRDGRVTGALPYRTADYGGELTARHLLCDDPISRTLLLRFLATHVDQFSHVSFVVAPDARPELWATDFAGTITTTVTVPHPAPPMVRVLDLPALTGLPVGESRIALTITDDPLIGGDWLLDGADGKLSVSPAGGSSDVRLTAAGLSALVYGVQSAQDLVALGLGVIPSSAWPALDALFPPADPWVYLQF